MVINVAKHPGQLDAEPGSLDFGPGSPGGPLPRRSNAAMDAEARAAVTGLRAATRPASWAPGLPSATDREGARPAVMHDAWIGERALRLGSITSEQLARAEIEVHDSGARGESVGLIGALLRSGALSRARLAELLAERAEGFRLSEDGVRLASMLRSLIAQGMRSFLFAGVTHRDGSDVVAARVGLAYALMDGGSVALIDCDVRQPSLHRLFAIPQQPGTLCVTAGRCAAREALHETGLPGLTVLPTERPGSGPLAEFLDAEHLLRLEEVRGLTKVVLHCAPPVLEAPETLTLSSRVDATLLVTAAARGRGSQLAKAERLLATARANVVGVVMSRDGS